jgi:hypothetical protein
MKGQWHQQVLILLFSFFMVLCFPQVKKQESEQATYVTGRYRVFMFDFASLRRADNAPPRNQL